MEELENKESAVFLSGPIHSYCEVFEFFRFYRLVFFFQLITEKRWFCGQKKEKLIDSEVKKKC